MNNTITAVPGIRVGHAQNDEALTGCTVILCEDGAVGGVDQRGGAPGTRETDLLRPLHRVEKVHGVLLTGGAAFGLDATGGVMRYLEERGVGFDVGVARVPIVPAAVIFDLAIGRADVRPDAAMAYQACVNATTDPVAEGNVGAGTGATVGKILGMQSATKTGVGSACVEIVEGLFVGAIAVVNALGDVIDPRNGEIIAGARSEGSFADTLKVMRDMQVLINGLDQQYCHRRGGNECEVEQRGSEQNCADGAGWTGARRASRAHHVRRRHDLCVVHGRSESRCELDRRVCR